MDDLDARLRSRTPPPVVSRHGFLTTTFVAGFTLAPWSVGSRPGPAEHGRQPLPARLKTGGVA